MEEPGLEPSPARVATGSGARTGGIVSPALSIVIPALDEEPELRALLPSLTAQRDLEVLVVDGSSRDGTVATAKRHGARVIDAPRGRGAQLDAGARAATGDALLFLHADARPPDGFPEAIRRTLALREVVLGAFSLGFDAPGRRFRLLERATHLRVGLTRTPYGDQGLFMRRADYDGPAVFPHWPMLEDVALVRRLRGAGRIVVLPEKILVSARRYRSRGFLRTTLRNRSASILWALRVPAPAILTMLGCRPVRSAGPVRRGLESAEP